jgi:PadR family transcriptional regulator, regulatory protein PadR
MARELTYRVTMYNHPPLVTEQALFVLASLARGELHGYGIARDVEELSEGGVRLTAGTLYGVLNRLTEDGLIAETREQEVAGRRRRYYRLTSSGETVLVEEAARLRSTSAALSARAAIAAQPSPGPA